MVTLLDLLQYRPTMFDDISLPEDIVRDTLVNEILFEGAQLFPIHQDPVLLQRMIEHYFTKRYQIHEELAKTLAYDYEPLENYDRQETRSRWETGKEDIDRDITIGTTGATENKVSAFNETTLQTQSRTDSTSSHGTEETVGKTTSGNSGDTIRVHGNIGVTTSQQMLEAQREVVKFSLYEYIASHFIRNFMIGLY